MAREGKHCPLPDTHTRLNQAFLLFEDLIAEYQDPVRFTGRLNNMLETLRSVTSILKKEKHNFPDFELWYGPHKDRMGNDEAMVWLKKSRNHVVHEGDLKKHSKLTVSIKNNLDEVLFSDDFDPSIPLREVAKLFEDKVSLNIPSPYKEETVIEIEREWMVPSFPETEIVELLIYCHGFLTSIVTDAHQKLGVELLECSANTFAQLEDDYRFVLRNNLKRHRRINFLYSDGRGLNPWSKRVQLTNGQPGSWEALGKELVKQYGNLEDIKSLIDTSKDNLPFGQLRFHIESAKHFLKIEEYLQPITFLYLPNKEPIVLVFDLKRSSDRHFMSEQIAEQVEAANCQAIIYVAEVWAGKMGQPGETPVPPRLQEDRKAMIWIVAANPEKVRSFEIEIFRDDEGNISFGEEQESSDAKIPFLTKVMKVWHK